MFSKLETRKTRVFAAKRHGLMMPTLPGAEGAAFRSISAIPGGDFAGFAGLQAESAHAFTASVEDQPVEVAGQVGTSKNLSPIGA